MTIFIWKPSNSAQVSHAPKVVKVQFGDGYAQRSPSGINTDPASWDLSFDNIDDVTARAIMSFMKATKGVTPFTWTDPDGRTALYTSESWNRNYVEEEVNSIRLKFEEFFG